jgi:hypothetical protein
MELYNIEDKNKYEVFIPSGIGEFYTQCPACSHKRKPINQKKRCFSWNRKKEIGYCFHCGSSFVQYKPFSSLQDHSPKLIGLPLVKQEYIKTNKQINSSTAKQINTIDSKYLKLSLGLDSNFGTFLKSIFNEEELKTILDDYFLGMTNDKSVIYWYIDKNYRLRSGKIMQYDALTGKRIKNENSPFTTNNSPLTITWVHTLLKKQGEISEDWEFSRCLFGEHLLRKYPDRSVMLLEGEKSAVITSVYFPNMVCLATGGSNMLSGEVCKALRDRKVIVVPDGDMLLEWTEKVNSLNKEMNLNLKLYSKLNQLFTDEQIEMKWDLADYLLNKL